jgi:APA family basic amino acid/polyamine antiporter
MALTFASYAVPGPWWAQRLVGVAAVLALAGLNYRGVTKTAALTRVLVACTLSALAVVVIGIWAGGRARAGNLSDWASLSPGGLHGLLQAAGLLFFAFAGYARIATMGEEVRDPARTIPRAIPAALAIAMAVYAVVAVSGLAAGGPGVLAHAASPLTAAVTAAGAGCVAPVVRIGGALASLGALLALIAGVGRTSLAMARNRDLPGWLAAVHPRFRVPHHAEAALAVVVSVLVLTTDLRGVIGFSSFGVLGYYAIANLSALTQPPEQRRWSRAWNVLGICGCVVLALSLPGASIVAGPAVLAAGLLGRLLVRPRVQS